MIPRQKKKKHAIYFALLLVRMVCPCGVSLECLGNKCYAYTKLFFVFLVGFHIVKFDIVSFGNI